VPERGVNISHLLYTTKEKALTVRDMVEFSGLGTVQQEVQVCVIYRVWVTGIGLHVRGKDKDLNACACRIREQLPH
jgi:hypothetical protein